uniref:Secreted protein n=1 Tax=Globisporangium ultimum (strain ATCC 200006 / CBS 805.95 / DAOM BR144) TaxID=431595 RepID=K3WCR1_GLOUD
MMMFGLLLFTRRALGWTQHSTYSHTHAFTVAALTATTNEYVCAVLAFNLLNYTPLLLRQASTLFVFEGIAITFKDTVAEGQVMLTLCFSYIKAISKRVI